METGKLLGDKLGFTPKEFYVDYTDGDKGLMLSEAQSFSVSIIRNYANTPKGSRFKYWYEDKFKNYPVMVFVAAESDKLEWPPQKWQVIAEVFNSLGWIEFLYIKQD